MTLLFTESFDGMQNNAGSSIFGAYLNKKWGRFVSGLSGWRGGASFIGAETLGGQAGRHGTGCRLAGRSTGSTACTLTYVIEETGSDPDTVIIGFARQFNNASSTQNWLRFGEERNGNLVLHIYIQDSGAGTMTVRRDDGASGVQLGSSFITPAVGTDWRYWEVKVKVHDSAGSVEIKIDGTVVFTVSGVDTRNGGAGTISYVSIRADASNATLYAHTFDDIYILKVDGSGLNDYLGDCTVEYLQPSGADTTNWSVTGAAANWDAVADAKTTVAPVTSDYVQSGTDDQTDLYTLEDSAFAAPNNVLAVATYAYAEKTDSGARTLALVHDLSGTPTQSSDQTMLYSGNNGPMYHRWIRELDPAGDAWSPADVNALKVGVKARP